jgi:hypothetical protein
MRTVDDLYYGLRRAIWRVLDRLLGRAGTKDER